MSGTEITIEGPDGSFMGYLAKPASGSGPGLIVIQEIFGVNGVMRDLCDEYAAHGFTALCPDLFWRIEPGIQLTDKTEEEWKQAFDLFGKFDVDAGVKDIGASISHLRGSGVENNKVGAVGYCLGGLLAYLTATRTDSDACVGYYGVNIQEKLDEQGNIKRPLLLHVAENDQFVPREAQAQIESGLQDNKNVTIHTYEGLDHAFARVGGEHYDEKAAQTANQRTHDFLKTHLA